jgi:hypothetical protein
MGWRGNAARGHRPLAARRLMVGPARGPSGALPWRTAGCPKPFALQVPALFEPPAPQKSGGLLDGFCAEPLSEAQLALNSNGRLLLLRLADIDWVEAADNGVALHVGRETHLLTDTFLALAAKLPPGRFLRISPSALVNVTQIKGLRRLCQSEWRVLLRNGMRLILTRGYGEHLRQAGWFLTASAKPLVCSRFPTGKQTRIKSKVQRRAG